MFLKALFRHQPFRPLKALESLAARQCWVRQIRPLRFPATRDRAKFQAKPCQIFPGHFSDIMDLDPSVTLMPFDPSGRTVGQVPKKDLDNYIRALGGARQGTMAQARVKACRIIQSQQSLAALAAVQAQPLLAAGQAQPLPVLPPAAHIPPLPPVRVPHLPLGAPQLPPPATISPAEYASFLAYQQQQRFGMTT